MRSFRPSFVCQGWLGSFLRRKRWGLSAWLPALLLVPPIPSPLGTTPIRRFIWPRQANLPSYLLYITRGLPRQELIVLHNTGLPADRVLAAAEAFQVVPGPALWDSSELHRARRPSEAVCVGGSERVVHAAAPEAKQKLPPPFLRRKDFLALVAPKRKPLPRMDNGFSCIQLYEKEIS